VQVEDVARVGLAPRGAAEQEGELTVRSGLLGEIVVDDAGVLTVVAEPLPHGAAGVGGDELERGRGGGRGGDHRRVLHGAVLAQLVDDLSDRRLLLPDRDVDAVHVCVALVDDGVDGDRRLSDLSVADDELTLAASDRRHGVDRLDAGVERLLDRLPLHDAGRLHLDPSQLGSLDGTLAVDRLPERVDHPTEQRLADRDLEDSAGATDDVPLADVDVLAHHGDPDVVLLEVEDEPLQITGKIDELPGHGLVEPVDARDPVADRQDRAGLGDVDLPLVVLDLLSDDLADLRCLQLHEVPRLRLPAREASCVLTLPSRRRLPTRATTPPRIDSSTSTDRVTFAPTLRANAPARARDSVLSSFRAVVTWATTFPSSRSTSSCSASRMAGRRDVRFSSTSRAANARSSRLEPSRSQTSLRTALRSARGWTGAKSTLRRGSLPVTSWVRVSISSRKALDDPISWPTASRARA
jgi:hypothetical protein